MAYAQELKNLVAEIKIGHRDRTAEIGEIKKETKEILREADNYMKKVATELKEMARDLKAFLAKSEEARKADFHAVIKEVRAVVGAIKKSTKDLLGDYKAERKEAARYWASLRSKETAPAEKAPKVK